MANYNTPGVYVEEIPTFPPSIAEVESAVPAFIGYTEKAENLAPDDLLKVPTRISSLNEYHQFFGGAAPEDPAAITINVKAYKKGAAIDKYVVKNTYLANLGKHIFYQCLKMFFANGGSSCYIVSVGKYADNINKDKLLEGLALVALEDIPTMLVIPEAVKLAAAAEYNEVVTAIINQAKNLGDRFAILDTYTTTFPKTTAGITADVNTVKLATPSDKEIRRYGAAYYPFVESTYTYNFDFNSLTIAAANYQLINEDGTVDGGGAPPADNFGVLENTNSILFNALKAEFNKSHYVLPPSAAVAGIIARVDREKGYWKAPANVGVANVIKPFINISFLEHGNLNIDPVAGKSINVIVWQPGNGTVLMGGRTLDGNDNEWRYINVRRFFSIVEESVKKSTSWAVFEPNTASTWVKVQSMIESYLFMKWRDGALAGAKPEQAYRVTVGLNKTMNAQDILEGRMIVKIEMAVSRPAEFIVLQFSHLMQQS
ncbi:MAG: phage tail sheath family protein [Bacteroidetes bacterium]|nr:phage tail sheath family protein [Bacteroidota bacterium]